MRLLPRWRKAAHGIAVICSSDKLYPDVIPQAAAKLKSSRRERLSWPEIPVTANRLGERLASTVSFS